MIGPAARRSRLVYRPDRLVGALAIFDGIGELVIGEGGDDDRRLRGARIGILAPARARVPLLPDRRTVLRYLGTSRAMRREAAEYERTGASRPDGPAPFASLDVRRTLVDRPRWPEIKPPQSPSLSPTRHEHDAGAIKRWSQAPFGRVPVIVVRIGGDRWLPRSRLTWSFALDCRHYSANDGNVHGFISAADDVVDRRASMPASSPAWVRTPVWSGGTVTEKCSPCSVRSI